MTEKLGQADGAVYGERATTKCCSTCKQNLPITQFYCGGTYRVCKTCHNRRVIRWQKSPAGQASVKRSQKKYKAKYDASEVGKAVVAAYRNSQKYKAYQSAYNQSEAGKARYRRYLQSEKGRAAQRNHRESEKTKATLTRLKTLGRLAEYARRYRQSPKGKAFWRRRNASERGRELRRRYQQSERGRAILAAAQRRHAKTEKGRESRMRYEFKRRGALRQAKNTLTWKEWQELLDINNHACFYCGITGVKLEKDHVVPVIPRDRSMKGGDHTRKNIVPACRRCNASKSNKTFTLTAAQTSILAASAAAVGG